MSEPASLRPRHDDTAADVRSLVQMGRLAPQSTPGAVEPVPGPPAGRDTAGLEAALADAGVTATAEDRAAMQALGKLDAATLEAVTRWVKAKPDEPTTPARK